MSVPVSSERRILTDTEFEAVQQSHYPQICELPREDLIAVARRVRDFRNKARDISRQQRREMRGKAAPRGATAARDNTGTTVKKQIFAGALKRLNKEIGRTDEVREDQSDMARRALELKRRNRVRHHPSAKRTARQGMESNPSGEPTVQMDPREIGRVSQSVKAGQARRDR